MQDRFLMRVYDPVTKSMIYDMPLIYTQLKYIAQGFSCEDLKLMQSTGLKDKNGKLIFEGDILFEYLKNEVYPNGKKWVVKWDNDRAKFYIKMINPSKYEYFKEWHLARHYLDYEIIGNIYENPEILEDNKC